MATLKEVAASRRWTRGSLLISTDPTLIPIPQLIKVFASDAFYWAKTLPEAAMKEMLENSLTFGLFDSEGQGDTTTYSDRKVGTSGTPETTASNPETQQHPGSFIGVARCVTDFVTFAYLTDVWVDPAYQGRGLGTWLVECVKEVTEEMPYLRRTLLFTSDWKRSVPFYERHLGVSVLAGREGHGPAIMERKGPGFPAGLK